MDIKYVEGDCSECGEWKLITHKSKKLCESCRQKGLKKTPLPVSTKPLARSIKPLARSTKPIAQQSASGKIRKAADVDFYRQSWESRQDWSGGCICEECRIYLPAYSSAYVSHILSRGAFPEFAHNPLNFNILCGKHHTQWETGDRQAMNIYDKNQRTIEALHAEKNSAL